MLPYIAMECRGRDRWYWRIEHKDGYSPWVGPYPTDAEALSVARDFCKREGDDGYARSLLKTDGERSVTVYSVIDHSQDGASDSC